jgi:antitoxin (DNA-binding transcriptional repressor) of toxin-antitoxin stability system
MQTVSIEAAQANFAALLLLVKSGEEVLISEQEHLVAKIVPADDDDVYRKEVRALEGFLKGMDTTLDRGDDRL